MLGSGDVGCCFYKVDAILHHPVEDFHKGEDDKGGEEADGEILSEDGHCEKCFDDCLAHFVIDALDFRVTESPEEHLQKRKKRRQRKRMRCVCSSTPINTVVVELDKNVPR